MVSPCRGFLFIVKPNNMKTIADFKRKIERWKEIGGTINSSLYWVDGKGSNLHWSEKDGTYKQVNTWNNRAVKVVQSNSFALSMDDSNKVSWCDWPKKNELQIVSDNEVNVLFDGGKINYQFIEPA